MTELARFPLNQGGSVTVEIEPVPGVKRASRQQRVIQEARMSFERAFTEVRQAASAALAQFQDMTKRPDQVEITFGVQLDAEAGAVIARTGVQGHFKVTLRWQNPDPTDTAVATAGGESTAG